MSEGTMKKIQPFTIGTKLSVPCESRCPDFVDIILPIPALDGCKLRSKPSDKTTPYQGQSQKRPSDPDLSPVEGLQEEGAEEERSSASSRSIRKIAICVTTETHRDSHSAVSDPTQSETNRDSHSVVSDPTQSETHRDSCSAVSDPTQSETHRDSCSAISDPTQSETQKDSRSAVSDPTQSETHKSKSKTLKPSHVEGGFEDRSTSQLKEVHSSQAETWIDRNLRDLKCGCSFPACPPQHMEEASHTQTRDLKDFENSLIQLTASLDMKQDEPQGILQKQTDHMGLSLEKCEKTESIRENDDELWLKLRSLLRDYHQDLMLALDVSSFYQQADNIICTINNKRSSLSETNVQGSSKDCEIMGIASQIRMLNEAVSRLSNLHPTLASRVTRKQAEVKERWAVLQETGWNQRPDVSSNPAPGFTKEDMDPLAIESVESHGSVEHEVHCVMGKNIKEEHNRLRGFESSQDPWINRMLSPIEECTSWSQSSISENTSKLDTITERQQMDWESSKDQMTDSNAIPPQDQHKPSVLLQESTTSTDKTLSWLKDNITMAIGQEKLSSEEEAQRDEGNAKIEELLGQVEVLWEVLRRRHGGSAETEAAEREKHFTGNKVATPEGLELSSLPHAKDLQENAEECNSGMLTKFLELLDQKESHEMQQVEPGLKDNLDFKVKEELLNVMEDQNETGGMRVHSQAHDQATEQLLNLLSTLTLQLNQHQSRCAELSMDILDLETDMAVLCDPALGGLEGLQEQQDDLEVDYHIIEGEVEDMERLATRLQVLPPEQAELLGAEVQVTLQAWEEVGRSMAENRGRLLKFRQLQDFFENYLAMIAWTEDTRACIFSGSAVQQCGEGDSSVASELELRIEQKLQEFDRLATSGQRLMDEGHHLAEIIRERTDELHSMLGWIQMNCRTQKDQLGEKQKMPESNDAFLPQETLGSGIQAETHTTIGSLHSVNRGGKTVESQLCPSPDERRGKLQPGDECHRVSVSTTVEAPQNPLSIRAEVPGTVVEETSTGTTSLGSSICLILSLNSDDQSPIINQVQRQQSPSINQVQRQQSPSKKHVLGQQSPGTNQIQRQQSPGSNQVQQVQSPAINQVLGQQSPGSNQVERQQSTSNNQLQSQQSPAFNQVQQLQSPAINIVQKQLSPRSNQVPKPVEQGETAEATHRVSTYLHVTDSSKTAEPVCVCVSPPLNTVQDQAASSIISHFTSSSSSSSSSSFSFAGSKPEVSTVFIPTSPRSNAPFSLNRETKPSESHSGRHTTLCIVGLDGLGGTTATHDGVKYSTCSKYNTWPIGGRKKMKRNQSDAKPQVFVKNNSLVLDAIHADKANMAAVFKESLRRPRENSDGRAKSHCCYLSLGSMLSFNLPKDLSQVPQINVKVPSKPLGQGPAETNGGSLDSNNRLSQPYSPTGLYAPRQIPHASVQMKQTSTLSPREDRDPDTILRGSQNVNPDPAFDLTWCLPQPEMDDSHCEPKTGKGSDSVITQHNTTPATDRFHKEHGEERGNQEARRIRGHPNNAFDFGLPKNEHCCMTQHLSHACTDLSASHHKCLSVHTKIKDLIGHIYHVPKDRRWDPKTDPILLGIKGLSSGQEDSVRSSFHKPGRIIVCAVGDNCEVCYYRPVSKSTEVAFAPGNSSYGNRPDALQLGHWLFQEEEEELEDIWNGSRTENVTSDSVMKTEIHKMEAKSRGPTGYTAVQTGDSPPRPSQRHPGKVEDTSYASHRRRHLEAPHDAFRISSPE